MVGPLKWGTSNPRQSQNELIDLKAGKKVDIDVSVTLPDLFINGNMRDGDVIPIGDAFSYFFEAKGPDVTSDGKTANITNLGFSADPLQQTYSANTEIHFGTQQDQNQGWKIDLGILTIVLEELQFWIDAQNGKVGGGISGVLALIQGASPSDYEKPRLMVSAEYPIQDPQTPEGWTFSGHLYQGTSIDLTTLVAEMLGLPNPPASVPHLNVDRLDGTFSTGSKAYSFGGTISTRWTPDIFGTPLKISAAASIDIARAGNVPAKTPASGQLSGMFAINKISIQAAMDVGVAERTYLFKIIFDNIWLQAVTAWRGDKKNRHQVLSLQLGGVTVGDVLEYLVNIAAPTLGFKLDAPWDMLKRIELSKFVLTLDPTDNVVEFVYKADIDMGFGRLSSIGVRYTREGSGKVDMILEGTLLGQSFEGEDALAWDVINDPPPAVPGTGPSLVDLRYLGIGQRIQVQNPPDSVSGTLDMLKEFMKPVDNPANLPASSGVISFAADSEWLIGLDIGILEDTLDLGFIFNDPIIYGLSIGLNGERAGPLAGLRFEILYKKISDNVGMFKLELRIPDAFRSFQMGVATFTLGTVGIEIYTNGNFLVDAGFPYNRNFDRSFSLQAYIFIGRGGFYFGVLDGETSRNIPKITNGTFSPVLELGVGLAAGVGREFRAGILVGGAYIQIEVIFQGVLGWFHPSSNAVAPANYFKATGIVALHGKIYGKVDFKVVKVSVTLDAYAQVSAIFESYKATEFTMEVSVTAKARIKILFIHISFHFHVSLEFDYTLGSNSQTPWILSPDQSHHQTQAISARLNTQKTISARSAHSLSAGKTYVRLATQRNPKQKLAMLKAHHLKSTTSLKKFLTYSDTVENLHSAWDWQPDKKLFADEKPRTAQVHILPAISLDQIPVSWTSADPVKNTDLKYNASFILCANSGVSSQVKSAIETKNRTALLNSHALDESDTDALTADLLVTVFLLYSLYSIPNGPISEDSTLTIGQLSLLSDVMNAPHTADAGFTMPMLDKIFKNNLHLRVLGDPKSVQTTNVGGLAIPMPPHMSWVATPGGNIDFDKINPVGTLYEWGISQALNKYFPIDGDTSSAPTDDNPANYESFPTFVFRDYCFAIAKASVQETLDLMKSISLTVVKNKAGDNPSLKELAETFASIDVSHIVRAGDTLQSIAETVGVTLAELTFLNPQLETDLANATVGASLSVHLGVAPEVIAMDNADIGFACSELSLGDITYQVQAGDTFNKTVTQFDLAAFSDLFEHKGALTGLGISQNLLKTNTPFDYPIQTWTVANSTRMRAAATTYTRYKLPVLEQAHWYAQAIADLNKTKLDNAKVESDHQETVELPPELTLKVPSVFNDVSDNLKDYTTIIGDSLERIATMLTLEQLYPTSSPKSAPGWQDYLNNVSEPSKGTYHLPAQSGLLVNAGETVESLARRMIVDVGWVASGTDGIWTYDWNKIGIWLGDGDVLCELAVILIADVVAKIDPVTKKPLTFNALMTKYNLPISDIAQRIQTNEGLYPLDQTLTVSHLVATSVKDLKNRVLAGDVPHFSGPTIMLVLGRCCRPDMATGA